MDVARAEDSCQEAVPSATSSYVDPRAHALRERYVKWQTHWPLPDADIEAIGHRERVSHSLGNLTLVNGKLNPTLSHHAWPTKQQLLSDHAVLYLNKELFNGYANREWDETAIRERGAALATRARSIWLAPSAV